MKRILIFIQLFLITAFAFGAGLTDRIHYAIEEFIYERVVADSLSISFDAFKQKLPAVQHLNDVHLEILWNQTNASLSGKSSIPVQISENNEVLGTLYTTVRVRVFNRVYVSTSVLNRHLMLRDYHVKTAMRETTKLLKTPLEIEASIAGKRTKRVVGKERIITIDMLETPPVIRRGDRVTVKLNHHNLEITLNATAREDGWLGDQIKVRDVRSRSELMGKVVGPSVVRVQY